MSEADTALQTRFEMLAYSVQSLHDQDVAGIAGIAFDNIGLIFGCGSSGVRACLRWRPNQLERTM